MVDNLSETEIDFNSTGPIQACARCSGAPDLPEFQFHRSNSSLDKIESIDYFKVFQFHRSNSSLDSSIEGFKYA